MADEESTKPMADEQSDNSKADKPTTKPNEETTMTESNEESKDEAKEQPPPKSKPYKIKKYNIDTEAREERFSTFKMNKLLMRAMFVIYLFYFGYKWLYKSSSSNLTFSERAINYKNYLLTPPNVFPEEITKKQLTIIYCSTCKFTKSVDNLGKSIASNLKDLEGFKVFLVPYKNAPLYNYMNWGYTFVQIGVVVLLIYMAETIAFIEMKTGFKFPAVITNGLMFLSEKRIMLMFGIYMSGGIVKNFLLDSKVYDAYYEDKQIWNFEEMGNPSPGRLVYLIEQIEGISVF